MDRLNQDYTFVHGTFSEGIEALRSGYIDMLLGVAYSDERADEFLFTSTTFFVNWGVLYTRPGTELISLIQLEGKRVASVEAAVHTIGQGSISDLAHSFGIAMDLLLFPDYASTIDALVAGQADVAVVNRVFGLIAESQYEIVQSPILFNPVSLRVALSRQDAFSPSLARLVDRELQLLIDDKSSEYYDILAHYLPGFVQEKEVLLPWAGRALGGTILLLLIALGSTAILFREVRQRRRTQADLVQARLRAEDTLTQLHATQEQLVDREKQSAFIRLSAGLAHELNNPLNYITMGVDSLLWELQSWAAKTDPPTAAEFADAQGTLKGIQEGAMRAALLARRVHAMTVGGISSTGTLLLSQICTEVIELSKVRYPRVQFTLDVVGDFFLPGNHELLTTAIQGLVENATLAQESSDNPRVQFVVDSSAPGKGLLYIYDWGVGVSRDIGARVFDPFFTTWPVGKGAGLGLPIARRIIEGHRGTVKIHSPVTDIHSNMRTVPSTEVLIEFDYQDPGIVGATEELS